MMLWPLVTTAKLSARRLLGLHSNETVWWQCARYPIHYKTFYGESSVERGYLFGNELIRQGLPYTALFVADCQVAVGIVNALQHGGYNIPKDISILCFDDSVSISEYGLNLSTITYDPLVSCLRQPKYISKMLLLVI